MHLLGGSLGEAVCAGKGPGCDPLADYPRMNFETFENGVFTSFRFMLGSGWSLVLRWYIEVRFSDRERQGETGRDRGRSFAQWALTIPCTGARAVL
jgi:hypothetical protein